MTNEDYKNVGFKVPESLHHKLKLMSAHKRKSITDIVVPKIREIVEAWEKEMAEEEINSK